MAPRDYYKILGVGRDADQAAIKRAYRRLALEYHPDRHKAPRSAARFMEIQEAYAILSDPEKRRQYELGQRPAAARPDKKRARADAVPSALHVVVEGLGLRLGVSLGTRSVSATVGRRRSTRRGTATRRASGRNRRTTGA